jgi:hypothetical protein
VQRKASPAGPEPNVAPSGQEKFTGWVTYDDRKGPTTPPPPPRWPVYLLSCGEGGTGCTVEDVKTGRTHPAGTMYAGYVRLASTGRTFVSPRPDVYVRGDSHPTIAAASPEGQREKRTVLAAGEVGIVDGTIAGHNDKTGHYMSRRNQTQSGMPEDRYHAFTEDPRQWFRKARGGETSKRKQTPLAE